MGTILILGATSDIARAVAHRFAREKFDIILAGRDKKRLSADAGDLAIRHKIETSVATFDAAQFSSHKKLYDALKKKPDVVVLAFGYLGDQKTAEADFHEAHRIIDANYTGAVSILEVVAADFEKRKSGSIIAISSVAGDRGRQSNYIYGSAKGGLSAYLSGLRNRLSASNVPVLTVKPGFVATRMTEGMALPGALTAKPESVANEIFRAWKKKKNILYTKWMWRYIMLIIIHIPEFIFKKLKL